VRANSPENSILGQLPSKSKSRKGNFRKPKGIVNLYFHSSEIILLAKFLKNRPIRERTHKTNPDKITRLTIAVEIVLGVSDSTIKYVYNLANLESQVSF